MIRRMAVLAAALLVPAGLAWGAEASGAAAPAPTLSLDQAVRTALEGNQGLRLKREAVQRAEAGRAASRALRMPQVQVQASQLRTGPIRTVEFPSPEGPPMQIELGSPQTTAASIAVTQPLDVSHLIATGVTISDLNSEAARLDLGRSEQQVGFAARQAYFGVLQAQAYRDVARESLQAVEQQLRVARAHYEAGTAAHFDVLRAEVAVADAQQRLVTAANGVDLAKAALNNVLGADVNRPVEVEPMAEYSPVALDLPGLLDAAERSRLELGIADLRIASARQAIHLAREGRLPSLALTASYDYSKQTSAFGPEALTWTVVLGASMPIFDGGATSAKVAEARSDVASAQTAREQLRQAVALEVRQAYLSLEEAQARLEAAAKAAEQAREALRLAQVRYEAGAGIAVEVTDAVAALTAANTNHVNAIYDARISLARLENAVGAPLPEGRAAKPAASGEENPE